MSAYDELYLADAMTELGCFFDFAVNDYGAEGSEVAELFAMSVTGREFGRGNPRVLGGMSGVELFWELSYELGYGDRRDVEPHFRFERTPDYWAGWVIARAQWELGVSFGELFSAVPYDRVVGLYHPYHEADESRFVRHAARRLEECRLAGPTRLATLRREAGLSQQELASRARVSLRSIQMYEQRQKDVNHAQAATVASLAAVLGCRMEDLLEVRIDPALLAQIA